MKKITHIISTILSFINACVFFALRSTWFFINQEIGGNPLWARLVFGLFILIFIVNLLMLFKVKVFKFKHLLMIIPTLIFIGLNMYVISMLGSEKHIVIRNLLPLIPGFTVVALLFLLAQTRFKLNTFVKGIAALAVLMIIFIPQLNIQPVRITSGPNFMYVDDELVVMWTTNVKSTGFVEVGTRSNPEKITLSENGIIDSDTTYFKVALPDIEDGDIIRVGSTKIKNHYQNNVVYGKTVYSEFLDYEDTKNSCETSFYVLSDIHERTELYSKYLFGDDYDFVIYNGDVISSIDSQELMVSEFLSPITDDSQARPFYFVRGNHETRGADARLADDYLALENDRYYYTFTYGPVFFIVLDTAEDKADDHAEYGGLADFESYRREETAWLKSVVEAREYEDYQYIVAISHIPLTEDEEFPYKAEWMSLLGEMQTDVLLSGHTHKAEIIETECVPIVIGGGYVTANSGYEALKVTVGDTLVIDIITEGGKVRESYRVD